MKKGMDLTLNTIVVATVLLITAIVLIVIFGGGTRDFVSGLFGAGCQGKLRALCAPSGPGDDTNNDGISDSASFNLVDEATGEYVSGQCSANGQVSQDYNEACMKLSKKIKEARKSPAK